MYKSRKPGGGRKKLKPEYDAEKNLKEQMDAAVALYEEDCSLRSIADALALNPLKVRKLLITADVYESEVAEKVQDTFEEYRKTQSYKEAIPSTAAALDLSKASVTSYLPYQKGVYLPQIFFWSEFLRISFCIEEKCFHFFDKCRLIFFGQLAACKKGRSLFFYFFRLRYTAGAILLSDISVELVIAEFLLESGLIHKVISGDTKSCSNLLDCLYAWFTLVGFNIANRTV